MSLWYLRIKQKKKWRETWQGPNATAYSGEPRAQHAPRGPDGCLLLSPRPPPHPITPLTDAAEPISPSHQDPSTSHRWMRARTHAYWITLTTNFTRTTYDLYTQVWRGYPICMLFFYIWVRVVGGSSETKKERKAPSSPLPVYETPAYTIVYFSWTPRYVSVQPFIKCVFIDIIDNKTQSFVCSWRSRLVRGRGFDQMTDKLCCAECCYHISKNFHFMQLSSYSDWHY